MAKYIRCAACGKRIEIGDDALKSGNTICCNVYSFAEMFADFIEVSETKAKRCGYVIFHDAERIKELKEKIHKTTIDLKVMKVELAGLENANFNT
jgi:hypothetical protein